MAAPRSHVRAQITWLAVMDLACLVAGSVIGVVLRFGPQDMRDYVFNHAEGWLLLFGGVILANYLAGSYRLQFTFSRFNLIVTWMFSLVFALLILSITSYTWVVIVLGRGVLMLSLLSYSILSLFLKLHLYRRLFRSETLLCRTVILGTGDEAQECARILESPFVLPAHRVVAFLRLGSPSTGDDRGSLLKGIAVVNAAQDTLEAVVRSLDASLLVLAQDDAAATRDLYPRLRRLRFRGIEVLSLLNLHEIYAGRTPLGLIDEDYLMQASLESGLPLVWRVKRLADIILSVTAGVILLPFVATIAALIKLTAPRSPVFYSQLRVGRFGTTFRIHKFRTMRVNAESERGAVWAAADDPRITRLGRVLRRFRLDEIPQLVNIVKGEMSLVGPRPERPEITAQLAQQIPFYEERENVTPGLTGWAQIRHPYGASIDDSRRKLEYDLYYIKHLSLSLDLQIILSTVRIVVLGMERNM